MYRVALSCLVVFVAAFAVADDWPNWRGPTGNGVAPGKGYPTKWDEKENVRWKVPLPGAGASTPIVWQGKIFLTCGIEKQNTLLCLDGDGKTVWQVAIGPERAGEHRKGTGSNPSPITDGRHVFVYFKSGDLACVDFQGQIVWQHNLQQAYGPVTLEWDLGTSPVLTKDFVVVACVQSGPSYVAAYEKETGKLAWKVDRNLDTPKVSAQSYSTPVVVREGDRETLIVLGADHVTAHDAADGREVWRVGGLNPTGHTLFRSIASPVVSDGIVIVPYARGGSLTAIKLGGSGDVTKSHVLWTRQNGSAEVPTPVAVDGKVYVCTDRGEVLCLDIYSGAELAKGQMEKNRIPFSSSPILADGRLYLNREDCVVFIVELQGKELKAIGRNEVDDTLMVATPVFVDGRILLRTRDSLYCVEAK